MSEQFTQKVIAHIVNGRYVWSVDKYIVKLAFFDEKAKEYLLTPRQYFQLLDNFERTPKEYSTKRHVVVGYFNQKGYFAFSLYKYRILNSEFKEPYQYDLSDLYEEDE